MHEKPCFPQATQKPLLEPLSSKMCDQAASPEASPKAVAPEEGVAVASEEDVQSREEAAALAAIVDEKAEKHAVEQAAAEVDEAAAAAAEAEEELRLAQEMAEEAERERFAAEQMSASPPKQVPVRRDARDLAELMRKRRDVCQEFQSAAVEAKADASAEERKSYDKLMKTEEELAKEQAAKMTAEGGKKAKSTQELKEWMDHRKGLCSEIEKAAVEANVDACEEKKVFDPFKAEQEESTVAAEGKKARTPEELKEWMDQRRGMCSEIESAAA